MNEVTDLIPHATKLARAASYKYDTDWEDMLQHMMVRVVEASHQNSEKHFLIGAALNGRREFVKNHFRKFRTDIRNAVDIDDCEVSDDTVNHDFLQYEKVMSAAESAGIADMLTMRWKYGYTAEEVADQFGVKPQTVTQKLSNFARSVRPKQEYVDNTHCFVNVRNGREVRSTVLDLCKMEGIDNSGIYKVVNGKRKTYKGWRLK